MPVLYRGRPNGKPVTVPIYATALKDVAYPHWLKIKLTYRL